MILLKNNNLLSKVDGDVRMAETDELNSLIDQSKLILLKFQNYLKKQKFPPTVKRLYSPEEIELKKLLAGITLNINKIKRLNNFK